MKWETSLQYASQTDVGLRRANNEDACRIHVQRDSESFETHGHLFIVADGMGGHAVGELASKLAVDTIPLAYCKSDPENLGTGLRLAIEEANRVIHQKGTTNPEFTDMGTTCSVLVLAAGGAYVGHVGDSRIYRVRADRIDQLTFDHSLDWELRRHARVKPEEVFDADTSHVVTRSLGPNPDVQVDVEGPIDIAEGDAFILCSDGLTGHVANEEIGAIVGYLPPTDACRMLVNLALLRGGMDNVTVVVARAGGATKRERPKSSPAGTTTVDAVPGRSRNPGSAAMFGVAAILLLVCGTGIGVLGSWNIGAAIAVVGVALGVWAWLSPSTAVGATTSETRSDAADPESANSETVYWRPHATASAHPTRAFLDRLAELNAHVCRVARSEKWMVDWAAHEEAAGKAKRRVQQREFPKALRSFARTLGVLVDGLQESRRRQRQKRPKQDEPGSE